MFRECRTSRREAAQAPEQGLGDDGLEASRPSRLGRQPDGQVVAHDVEGHVVRDLRKGRFDARDECRKPGCCVGECVGEEHEPAGSDAVEGAEGFADPAFVRLQSGRRQFLAEVRHDGQELVGALDGRELDGGRIDVLRRQSRIQVMVGVDD